MDTVAMTQTSVSDPLVGLVDAIQEHTHRQQELIDCVRALRAFLVPAQIAYGAVQPDSQLIASPPPPLLKAPSPVQAPLPPPPPVQAPPPVQTTSDSGTLAEPVDSPPQLLLRALKRDYDYFTELDEKLARLSADLTTKDVDDVDGWPGATNN